MATGQELTPGQNARPRGEEGNHAMATGQELTLGQNASLDIPCEPNNGNGQQHGAQVTGFRRSTDIFSDLKPSKSLKSYDSAWDDFLMHSKLRVDQKPTEEMVLGYFDYKWKAEKKSSSTLWSLYSRINKMVQIKYGFKLQVWPRLTMLLKRAQQLQAQSGFNF